mmetsp:Transcript_15301/g.22444  ORF Transcript_15301/g.22444 Transcript_15301/m.22444 type:complete len:190 (-) Transcript_15301:1727-2296(-)
MLDQYVNLRLYWTLENREFGVGMMAQSGDPFFLCCQEHLLATTAFQDTILIVQALARGTLLRGPIHGIAASVRIATRVKRKNGTIVHDEATTDLFDFHQDGQQQKVQQQPYAILPGDSLEQECYYLGEIGLTVLGSESTDKMCPIFLHSLLPEGKFGGLWTDFSIHLRQQLSIQFFRLVLSPMTYCRTR